MENLIRAEEDTIGLCMFPTVKTLTLSVSQVRLLRELKRKAQARMYGTTEAGWVNGTNEGGDET
jgi:hypothetical protein